MQISKYSNKTEGERGIVALSIVLLLSAVLLTITITATYLSIGEAQSSLALSKGEQALQSTEGCVEDVMLKIRSNSLYAVGTFTHPEGANIITCSITYTLGGPTNWDLIVTTTATAYRRSIRVIFTRNPTGVTLTSWKEI